MEIPQILKILRYWSTLGLRLNPLGIYHRTLSQHRYSHTLFTTALVLIDEL